MQIIFDTLRRKVTCVTPAGSGTNVNVVVTVGNQASGPKPIYTYLTLQATSIKPSHGPAAGATLVTISGQLFGPVGSSPTVKLGSGGVLFTDVIVTQANVELTAKTPAGVGTNQKVVVCVGVKCTDGSIVFSYDGMQKKTPLPSPLLLLLFTLLFIQDQKLVQWYQPTGLLLVESKLPYTEKILVLIVLPPLL